MNRGSLVVGRRLRHGGTVVMNHAPTIGAFLENIGRKDARRDLLAFDDAIEVFV